MPNGYCLYTLLGTFKIMAQTVISKAKELIEEVGTEKAIAFFQKRIDDIGNPKNFQDVCNISGNETAIDFIKGNIK